MKILFFGDSVTHASRVQSADATPDSLLGQGYANLIAARLGADEPERFTFCNRGVHGNRLSELYARLEPDVVLEAPDVVSILAGINDCGFYRFWGLRVDPERFGRLYRMMLDEIRGFLPEVRFVLCEPFFVPAGSRADNREQLTELLPPIREVVREVAQERGLPFVALQAIFDEACRKTAPEDWLWDGIHPTPRGHQLIADEWIRCFRTMIS